MKKILIIALVATVTMLSCQKQDAGYNAGDVYLGTSTVLPLLPPVFYTDNPDGPATRGIVDGSQYRNYGQFSMFFEAVPTGTSVVPVLPRYDKPYVDAFYKALGYDNVSVYNDSLNTQYWGYWDNNNTGMNHWSFRPDGGSKYYRKLGLFATRGDVIAYAVYPYMQQLNKLFPATAIPFDISTGNDYMVGGTAYNLPYGATRGMRVTVSNADANGNYPLDIYWTHLMTSIEFQMKCMLVGDLVLDSITYEVLDASDQRVNDAFTTRGTFDAYTGIITPDVSSQTGFFKMEYKTRIVDPRWGSGWSGYNTWDVSKANYTSIALIFPGIQPIAGGKIVCKLYFQYVNKLADGTPEKDNELYNRTGSTIVIPFDNVLTNGSPQGFVNGTKYAVRVQIDNFIKYLGYPVPEPWKDDDATLPDIPF